MNPHKLLRYLDGLYLRIVVVMELVIDISSHTNKIEITFLNRQTELIRLRVTVLVLGYSCL